jgi:hypothetical protein
MSKLILVLVCFKELFYKFSPLNPARNRNFMFY